MLAALAAGNAGPLSERRRDRRVPADHVGVPGARAEAARRVSRAGRHVQPRRRREAFRRVRRRGAAGRRSTRYSAPSRAARRDYAVVPVENSTEGAVGRTLDLMCTTDLSVCGEVKLRVAAEPAVQREASLAGVTRDLLARAVARAMRALARARTCRRCRASPWRATRKRRGWPRPSRARPPSPARMPAAIYGLATLGAAHRGRAQQHDALLGARPPAGRRLGPRRDVARDVVSQSARRRVRAAGAARAPRRVDDALRIAPGAHRPVGIPVLRRPGRPSRRSEAVARRSAELAHKAPFLKLLGSYPAALD